jgi:3-deoxy-D-manno-octulosonic-acid transferase
LTRDEDELAAMLLALFADPARLRAMARAAAGAVETQGGAADRIMQALGPLLPAATQPALA